MRVQLANSDQLQAQSAAVRFSSLSRRYVLVAFIDRPVGLLSHADESDLLPEALPKLTALSCEDIHLSLMLYIFANLLQAQVDGEYDPAWWELAFTTDDRLAGLVMPTRLPGAATIGYIGVAPEMRGKGYGEVLLVRGTKTWLKTGAPLVRGIPT